MQPLHTADRVSFRYANDSATTPYLSIDCSCGAGPFDINKFSFHVLLNENLDVFTERIQKEIIEKAPDVKPNLTVSKAYYLKDTEEFILSCNECEDTGICWKCTDMDLEGCEECDFSNSCSYCNGIDIAEIPHETKWVITCSRDINNVIAYDTQASCYQASLALESTMSGENILKMFKRNELSKTYAHLNRDGIIQSTIDRLKDLAKSKRISI